MEYTLRVPTKDPYAYLEAKGDFESPGAAFEAYRSIQEAIFPMQTSGQTSGPGVEPKEWNRILDGILSGTGKLTADEWENMSENQRYMLNEYKKHTNRK